jgi:hypothetical protein
MFFEGTLQEGIATALQQGKLVVCFVTGIHSFIHSSCHVIFRTSKDLTRFTDGQDESQQWEIEFLGDGSVSHSYSDVSLAHPLLTSP